MRKIYFGKSNIDGYGFFAKKDIKKGEFVFRMIGKMHKLNLRTKEEAMSNPNMIGIKKDVWLDPSLISMPINHSCDPTTGIKGKVTFVGLRDIKKDEEITFDYSISEDSDWEMPCECGAKNCRKVIKGIKFLPEETYKRYLPYIPKYFQSVYRKYHKI
jgi:SET domain-containing protein